MAAHMFAKCEHASNITYKYMLIYYDIWWTTFIIMISLADPDQCV